MPTDPVIDRFLKSLIDVNNFSAASKTVAKWAKQGLGAQLYQTGLALETTGTITGIDPHICRYVFSEIVDALAFSPQPDFAAYAARLALIPPQKQAWYPGDPAVARRRDVAQKLAAGASEATLIALFEADGDDVSVAAYQEFLACLLQEMVLRGKATPDHAPLLRFHERSRLQGHSLARLPLHLLPIETQIPRYLPQFSRAGLSHGMPFGPGISAEGMVPMEALDSESTAAPDVIHVEKQPPAGTTTHMAAAFANWCEESNGKVEACTVAVSPRILPKQVTEELLLSCSLECLHGGAASAIALHSASPNEVMSVLFSAAATGGAYNHGRGGAYGRLEAWQSLAALAGCDFHDAEAVQDRVQACRGWWLFNAGSEWFYRVAWDAGIVALRPEGDTLAILAASDID